MEKEMKEFERNILMQLQDAEKEYSDLLAKHERVLEMLLIAEQGLKDAKFVFEGSVAIEEQSDEVLYKRSRAVERFLKALDEIESLKNG